MVMWNGGVVWDGEAVDGWSEREYGMKMRKIKTRHDRHGEDRRGCVWWRWFTRKEMETGWDGVELFHLAIATAKRTHGSQYGQLVSKDKEEKQRGHVTQLEP